MTNPRLNPNDWTDAEHYAAYRAKWPVESVPGLDKAKLWDAMKADMGVTWTELHPTRESWMCTCGHEFPTRYPLDSAEDLATPTGQRDKGVW